MDPRILFVSLVVVYSAFPILLATRPSSIRVVFLYVYISIVHVVGGFLGAVVSFPLTEGITVSGGSLAYGAFMMSTVVLVIVGRDLDVVRNVIKLVIATNVFKFALFSLTSVALESSGALNPFGTSSDVFSTSLRVVAIGGGLIILELLLLIAVFEKVKSRVRDPRALAGLYVVFFIIALCLDGVLFPPLALSSDPALGSLVMAGLKGKLVLACSFALPLTGFLIAFRSNVLRFGMTPLQLTELFASPREELVKQIGRKQAELEASEASYQQLAESIGDYLITLDRETRITYWNAAAESTGYPKEKVLGRKYGDVFPESGLTHLFARALNEHTPTQATHEIELEGERHIYEVSMFPYKHGLTVLSRDVTESRRSREREMHAQKMEAIEDLAGGITRDFNKLLSEIESRSASIQENLASTDPNRADIEGVMEAGTRAGELVRKLSAFSRKGETQEALVSLGEVVRHLNPVLKRTIPESVTLQIDVTTDALVEVDRTQLEQSILNLAVNARDAMPSGGTLIIAATETTLDEDRARSLELAPGPYALLRVTDTGEGMSEEVVERIFEPFFTTKTRGSGTGLGLAGVYGTVTRAGGHVAVSSAPGEGSTFEIFLPSR